MSSTATRSAIVLSALSLAGRSTELKTSANEWLNYFLLHVGLTFQFPELRKVGSSQTLALGTSTVALPTDLGNGMDKFGMIFGPNNQPLPECSFEEFSAKGGFSADPSATGKPQFYLVDKNAGVFRFNVAADQNYAFTPVYFIKPTLPSTDPSGDSDLLWLDNDIISVSGLMWFIYMFTEDAREPMQEARVERLLSQWKRETVKIGGSATLQLAQSVFKRSAFRGT